MGVGVTVMAGVGDGVGEIIMVRNVRIFALTGLSAE